ncbi:MAG TPA: adenylate/guanylate cyclase domain-containing protein [Solirubrobacteraceae bacterium]|nr:adenylate/guanylate cyclase domain-containing protein [Solirubrobacteraceae bacterium]
MAADIPADVTATSPLAPYIPMFVADWLRDSPQQRYRPVDCTLVFADISGFTRMTEMLADQGKAGAEEMAGLINSTFEPLLHAAYSYGAGLIKWGGDATLLLFHGERHATRACRAAAEMQRVVRRLGTRQTSRGPLRLRMSIGVSTGRCDFFLVGHDHHRELLVLGPVATTLTQMEKVAEAGQIVISQATVHTLAESGHPPPTERAGEGWLLSRAPRAEVLIPAFAARDVSHLSRALSPVLCEYILADALENEHRYVSVGFIKFTGTDRYIAEADAETVADALDHVVRAAQLAAQANEVTFLATDIGPDCGKIMLTAGAPRRLGGDEARMVATLREVIDARGLMPVSAGVTAGRAFSGDYGPRYRRTYSLMGDCVNLAARLMAHAPNGELLASENLVQVLDGAFTAVPRPPFAAKGKSLPVHPFSLGAPAGSRPSVTRDAPPLIGRDRELAALMGGAASAVAGNGRVLELLGGAGMGKSRLLTEFKARCDLPFVWTQGEVYAGMRPYAPLERLIRAVCGLSPNTTERQLTNRLTLLTDRFAPELTPWLPLVGIAAGLDLPATPEVDQTDPSMRKERLEKLTSELLGRLLPEGTVLVLNDLHLMDDASRDLIRRLVVDTPPRPWLLVISRRPDSEDLIDEPDVGRIELGPLGDGAAAELLAHATAQAPLPPDRLVRLAKRAAGNPLFLRELSSQLSEGGDLDTLPSTVEDAIAARIDRLDPAGRRVLRAAAVLGMDVETVLLEAILAPERDRLSAGIELQPLGEFLDAAGPSRYRFSHELIRQVAYDALPYGRRTVLHGRTATAIRKRAGRGADAQADLLSLHCFHGAQYQDAWHFSILAAERARARYANAEAADSYRRALASGPHVQALEAGELAKAEEGLGELCVNLGETKEAEATFRRGLDRVRDQPELAARLQLKMVWLRELTGKNRSAMQWARRAERTLGDLDGPEVRALRADVATWLARLSYRVGHHADTLRFAADAVRLAEETGNLMTLAEAIELADSSALELGRPAGEGAARALVIYQELGALRDQARVRNTLGVIAYHRGEWVQALEHYAASEQAYVECGELWSSATPAANRAEILADQGDLDEATKAFERAMTVWRSVEAESFLAFGDYQLGRIAARQARHDDALTHLRAARDHFKRTGETTQLITVDAFTAESLSVAGHHSEALALAEATLRRAEANGGSASTTPLLQRVRGLALLALGDEAAGEDVLRLSLDAARACGAGHDVAFALGTLIDAGLAADALEEDSWRTELAIVTSALGLEMELAPTLTETEGQVADLASGT